MESHMAGVTPENPERAEMLETGVLAMVMVIGDLAGDRLGE